MNYEISHGETIKCETAAEQTQPFEADSLLVLTYENTENACKNRKAKCDYV